MFNCTFQFLKFKRLKDAKTEIRKFVVACPICQGCKGCVGPHEGSQRPEPKLEHPFGHLLMQFVDLPETKPGTRQDIDCAMVIVCCRTGYILAIWRQKQDLNCKQAAQLFLNRCALSMGLPRMLCGITVALSLLNISKLPAT